MLRKLKWQIPGEPLAAQDNWCQGPVPGRGPAVEKHWSRTTNFKTRTTTLHVPHDSKMWLHTWKTLRMICKMLYWPFCIISALKMWYWKRTPYGDTRFLLRCPYKSNRSGRETKTFVRIWQLTACDTTTNPPGAACWHAERPVVGQHTDDKASRRWVGRLCLQFCW